MHPSRDHLRHIGRATAVGLLISCGLHALWLLGSGVLWKGSAPIELKLPDTIELGIVEQNPGAEGASAPAAPPVAPSPPPSTPKPKRPRDEPKRVFADDAVVAPRTQAQASSDAAATQASASTSESPADASAVGLGALGLGFGEAGFGAGTGGAEGAVIGLHVDLESIAHNSLLLELGVVLGLIPEWQELLAGSGIDPVQSFSRIFVATPNLMRGSLVVSARFRGGEGFVDEAVQRLAHERGAAARFETRDGLRVAPWLNRGPTERLAALVAPDQLVIARPSDVKRVLSVAAALAERHAKEPGMEQAKGPAALLAMYEGEDAALSVEAARAFVAGDNTYVPQALRISLRHLDEFHAELRVFGYYESADKAASAQSRIDQLRLALADHPRVIYLGLRSALQEATLSQQGPTLTLQATLTLHQLRYLLAYVRRGLGLRY